MKKTCLVICPSRGRPGALKDMIESCMETKCEDTKILVYLNQDDPELPKYRDVIFPAPGGPAICDCIIGPRMYISEVYNKYSRSGEFDYYVPINDDHYFHTIHWDRKLIQVVETKGKGWGLAGANDLQLDWKLLQHPSGCVISSNIIQTLGYMVWPGIRHIGTDTMFMKLMQGIDRLFLIPEVIIEHRHWLNGKRPIDDNYKWVYGKEEQEHGLAAIQTYLFSHLEDDIRKLKLAMGENK